ncbi:MAG: zinc-binding dehydrogenase [Actinophytocola sp.]|uniref:quinone oxidoreductase family protein n=1 Tax=Actinophytocola sp. TaxID=1872138 RepID=UPI001329B304|nr:zinc-binding dehydrogenase [Actinophytocola sp.]MPZ82767.1 zinc-binding dehydrogenase [Actinophytocola sp.]
MRRVRYHAYGGPEVLRVEEAEVPEPGPGQVRLRTEVIGANFIDTKFRRGRGALFQRPLPATLTGDVVGTVEAVGSDVDTALIGRRVAALTEDAFADFALADARWLATVPSGLDEGSATMLPLAAPVALGTLRTGRLEPGETVLVHAAAGGIGHLAVQLAKLLGAGRVIATAGSPAKLDFARAQGADAAVDYTAADWPDQVRAAAPNGVDVVLDSVGGQTMLDSLDLLAPYGRLVAYGVAAGELADIPLMKLYELRSVVGFSLLAWRSAHPDEAARTVAELTGHFAAGRLRTTVHTRLPLTEAAKAHQLLDDRAQLGRIILVP